MDISATTNSAAAVICVWEFVLAYVLISLFGGDTQESNCWVIWLYDRCRYSGLHCGLNFLMCSRLTYVRPCERERERERERESEREKERDRD